MAIRFAELDDEDKAVALAARISQLEEEAAIGAGPLQASRQVGLQDAEAPPMPPEWISRHREKIKEVLAKRDVLVAEQQNVQERLQQSADE